MKDYFISLGWYFIGTCGCTPKRDDYANSKYPEYELSLGSSDFRIQSKKSKIKVTILSGGMLNFKEIYHSQFPEEVVSHAPNT